MVLVCVSHVRVHFVDSAPELYYWLTLITRFATPTFLLLSGFVAAYVLAGDRPNRLTVFDRGLFVLLCGHFLLNLADLRHVELDQWIFGRVTITDAIAICLMSAVVLHRLSAAALAILGVALAVLSWPIAMMVSVDSPAAGHIGAALFSLRTEANALIDAAIVPYLGVFLIGMALSKTSFEWLRHGRLAAVARRLSVYGIAAMTLVFLGLLGWQIFKRTGVTIDSETAEFARLTLDPRSKLPPSPAYLLFYGGGGLVLGALCLAGWPRFLMQPLVDWAATIGRASMMCFVVQDWLLRLLPVIAGVNESTSVLFWTLYLVLVVLVLHWLATRWDAKGANRFLTLGLKNLVKTQPQRAR